METVLEIAFLSNESCLQAREQQGLERVGLAGGKPKKDVRF
jgi:hypothetical protein